MKLHRPTRALRTVRSPEMRSLGEITDTYPKTTSRAGKSKPRRVFTNEELDELKKLYYEGMSTNKLAYHFHTSITKIQCYLIEMGIG